MGFVVVAAVSETPFVNSSKQCWRERPLIFPLHNTTNLVWKNIFRNCKGLIILVYFACRTRCITAVMSHFFLSSGGTAYCWMSTHNWSFTYWLLKLWRDRKFFSLKVQFEIQYLTGNEFVKLLVYSRVHYWTHTRSKLVMVILWTCPDLCWCCEPPVFVIYRRIIELTFSSDFYATHTLS